MYAHDLAQRWMIPIDRAKRTVKKTSQRGIRKILHPGSSVCRPDTLIAGTVSKRGNKYSQVFGTSFGWTRSYPIATKGQAHEALSLLFVKLFLSSGQAVNTN